MYSINNNLQTSDADFKNSLEFRNFSHNSKFKFEHGGMLVYDVKAKITQSSENNEEIQIKTIPRLEISEKNYIKGISAEDFDILSKIKKLPPCPVFITNSVLFIPDDGITLTFDSKFESGNLSRAIKLSDYEYNLHIQSDMHTTGNNH